MTPPPQRFTLKDLPLPAKVVVTAFLISVGIGYLWAMAQIHFKHASPGEPLPSTADLVARFSGVPWPNVADDAPDPDENKPAEKPAAAVAGVRVKTILNERCVNCHKPGGEQGDHPLTNYAEVAKYLEKKAASPKGRMHKLLQGAREDWDDNMVAAFFEQSPGWDKLSDAEKKAAEPKREAERLAVVAWIEAGGVREHYEADAFPLPAGFDKASLTPNLVVEGVVVAAKKPVDRRQAAKEKQIGYESLTQSTHAHLLSFSMLWALTGFVFAFTTYSVRIRCFVGPVVLVAQVLDIACWWLARLDGVGPYFAISIVATGGIVGLGLAAQITLSLWNMYDQRGKAVIAGLFTLGACLFVLTYFTVIKPQLTAEKAFVAQQGE